MKYEVHQATSKSAPCWTCQSTERSVDVKIQGEEWTPATPFVRDLDAVSCLSLNLTQPFVLFAVYQYLLAFSLSRQ